MSIRQLALVSVIITALLAPGCGCRKHAPQSTAPQAPPALPNRTVHVLCYHNLVAADAKSYDTTIADFVEQLQALRAAGYQSISCAQLADYLANVKDIPDKSVIISFDDGRLSVLKAAAPTLDKYGFKATIFLITGAVGGSGSLSWADVKQLAGMGYEIGSHTVSHQNLTKVPPGLSVAEHQRKVRQELDASALAIERYTGQAPVALAYPYGNYDNFTMRAARDAGYRVAFSIDPGAIDNQSDAWTLPRKMVVHGTALKTFQRFLATEPLHLSGVQPAIGLHYGSRAYKLQARVTDADALESLSAEVGKGSRLEVEAQTSQITLTGKLNKGANLVRLSATGTPRREAGWVVVCDPPAP